MQRPIRYLTRYFADERDRRNYLDGLFDRTARDYDFVESLLALGTGSRYRRDALRRAGLAARMQVLDVATGTGLVAREARGLGAVVIGLDPSAGMLGEARRLSYPLVRGLGERLPFRDACFDFVSMGFALRHVADLDALFAEMRRVLVPGGTACVLEITRPANRLLARSLRVFMTRVVPAVARVARRDGASLMQFYWDTIDACVPPDVVLASLARAGFPKRDRNVTLGMFSEYVARK
ncbi:MAG TPA: class I SAM-dependent methyltransferase [Casimicrobiaceae bacterium]|nr:class I SAM-dependent methyltransferase [Casimicrobiaceae bacterium]